MKVQIVIFDVNDVSPDYDVFVAPFIDRDKMVPRLIKRSQEYGWWDDSYGIEGMNLDAYFDLANDWDGNITWFTSNVLDLTEVEA